MYVTTGLALSSSRVLEQTQGILYERLRMNDSEITVHGKCDSRFAAVRDAFVANFRDHQEVGACIAVSLENELVVDLWAGWADQNKTRPWQQDTLVNVWSVGKAIAALTALNAFEKYHIDVDSPVADIWPEFAAANKGEISIAMLMSHQAGLCAISDLLPRDAFFHWEIMQAALARQAPFWEPGTAHGYHTNTLGFLVGEPVRRLTGSRFCHWLEREITGPMGVDFYFGVDPTDLHRCAEIASMPRPPSAASNISMGSKKAEDPLERMRYLVYQNPPLMALGVNSDKWRLSEFPSTSPHANARSVATIFGELASSLHHQRDGLISYELLKRASSIHSDGEDLNVGRPTRFGLGFQLTQPDRPLGPNPNAFGHYGNGGHLGFADPAVPLGFAYHLNHQGYAWRDPRNIALTEAVYACI